MRYRYLLVLSFMSPILFAQNNLPESPSNLVNMGVSKALKTENVSIQVSLDSMNSVMRDELPLLKSVTMLNEIKSDYLGGTRSARDASLFKVVAPSVVLITTRDSIGSGSLINSNGEILTNWHVVGANKEVGVIFKPARDTQEVSNSDIRRGKVIKVDEISDLALIKVLDVPNGRKPVKLGDSLEINIGADVHAIGHPRGEAWTYTKGVISQYRNKYQWGDKENPAQHLADVIQTQTPINPGNSGGPLLSDNGSLIGVNSFKAGQSEGLNFAVSIDDVKSFLSRPASRYAKKIVAKPTTACEMKEVYKGKTKDGSGEMVAYDSKCSGRVDIEIIAPDNKSEPFVMRLDRNADTKPDVVVFSFNRDWKWNLSFWDENYDGVWDLAGFHPDGEAKPSNYEPYKTFQARVARK